MPSQPTKASQCRRNAYYCQMLATDAANQADRAALMTMRRAWLALADNEEWLAGSSEPNGHDHAGRFPLYSRLNLHLSAGDQHLSQRR